MKLPEKHWIHTNSILEAWRNVALEIGIESGIFVDVKVDVVSDVNGEQHVTRVAFKVMDHEFENLHDLKKALANKAFL